MIYADNAATTRLDPEVLEAMLPYLKEEYSNASQPYSFSRSAKKALKASRETIASIINAEPEEIFFTSCGSESDNWAIKGVDYSKRKQIITSLIEHHAILHPCETMKRQGVEIIYLKPDKKGIIDEDNLRNHLSNNTALVSIMTVNNEIGTIEPIKELCKTAHEYGALFHTDAVQAIGHLETDVKDSDVDMLSSSAHKFNGPKGIGFMYIKKGVDLYPFQDGGAQERNMRAGTENVASIAGMAKALEINYRQLKESEEKLLRFEKIIIDSLNGIDYLRNGSDNHAPGNMSLSFRGFDGEAILHRLDLNGICVATGSACTSGKTGISHVLQAIDLDEEYARGTIRISLGRFNTEDEIRKIADSLNRIIR